MKIEHRFAFLILLLITCALALILYPYGMDSAVINAKGMIAIKERNLIITSTWLMLVIVIPVLLLTFFICLHYRATNKKAKYDPYWDHNLLAESIWWGFPCVIVLALSIIAWTSSHELDPYKPIVQGNTKPLKIQVVALQWKWLFIYPEQKIASLNFFQFPEKTPLEFDITSDAPMNSFWIPQLGGQIYAMPGMQSQLHLIANETGNFRGSSANLSGEGFASMNFIAKASSEEEFKEWAESAKQAAGLDKEEYLLLVKPSQGDPVKVFALNEEDLFEQIIMKYVMPAKTDQQPALGSN